MNTNFLSQERILELTEKYQLVPYQFDAFKKLNKSCDLCGKSILEIGGSNIPREVIFDDFGCKKWVSVDLIPPFHYELFTHKKHYECEKILDLKDVKQHMNSDSYVIFNGLAENIPSSFYSQFDIVVSITAFEHILKLPAVLKKCYTALKPNGQLYSYFTPIWSSVIGHHCWVTKDINMFNLDKIPKFGHLLTRPFEMLEYLLKYYNSDISEEIVHQVYFRDSINRLFYEDYEMLMKVSDFDNYECKPLGTYIFDESLLAKLMQLHPGYSRFDIYGMEIIASKAGL